MSQYIHIGAESGADMLIEVPDGRPGAAGIQKAGLGTIIQKVEGESKTLFESAIRTALSVSAASFQAAAASLDYPPDEMEVSFGLKVTGEAGLPVAIGKAGAEGNYNVKLVWKRLTDRSHDPRS